MSAPWLHAFRLRTLPLAMSSILTGSALAAFARFRVLCALREGPRGVLACNERLLALLPPAPARAAARPGQPVMVLRN